MSLNHLLYIEGANSRKSHLPLSAQNLYLKELFIENKDGTDIKMSLPNNYISEEDKQLNFSTEVELVFPLYLKGTLIDFNSKVFIKFNILYKFLQFSPDFKLEILEDGEILYSEPVGLESYPGKWNKLSDEVLLDVKNILNLRFRLSKLDTSNNTIYIKKNSIYILESL